jgi:hypothetical protein
LVLKLNLEFNDDGPQLTAPTLQVDITVRLCTWEGYSVVVVDLILAEDVSGTSLVPVLRLEIVIVARHSLPDAPKYRREEQALERLGSKTQMQG